jgi:hypothetical protein
VWRERDASRSSHKGAVLLRSPRMHQGAADTEKGQLCGRGAGGESPSKGSERTRTGLGVKRRKMDGRGLFLPQMQDPGHVVPDFKHSVRGNCRGSSRTFELAASLKATPEEPVEPKREVRPNVEETSHGQRWAWGSRASSPQCPASCRAHFATPIHHRFSPPPAPTPRLMPVLPNVLVVSAFTSDALVGWRSTIPAERPLRLLEPKTAYSCASSRGTKRAANSATRAEASLVRRGAARPAANLSAGQTRPALVASPIFCPVARSM